MDGYTPLQYFMRECIYMSMIMVNYICNNEFSLHRLFCGS